MSNWTRDDLPEFRDLLNALTDDDPDTACIAERLGLERVLGAVVADLNDHYRRVPKIPEWFVVNGGRAPAWMYEVAPTLARVDQEQRERAERAEAEARSLSAALDQLHREWMAEHIRANHAEAERDQLRGLYTADKPADESDVE